MRQEESRVKRTRRFIREAFVALVIEQGYEPVTVREIAERAGIGFKTFYRHYDGKEQLLQNMLAGLIDDFQEMLESVPVSGGSRTKTIAALEFTRDNAALFLALSQSPAGDRLLQPLLDAALAQGAQFAKQVDVPDELAAFHFAASIDALMKWWLMQGMPYSVPKMADYIGRLVTEVQPREKR